VPAPAYDPARAKQLLDDAGWKAGAGGIRQKAERPLRLELVAWAEVSSSALELLQSQLRAVGIDVVIKKAADTPTYNNYYRGNQFDLDLEVPNQNDGNPAFLPVLRMYSKSSGTERFAPGGEFDTSAERSLSSPTREGAQEASAQMMRILESDDFTVIPLAGVYRIYAMRKGVDLADPHPSQTNQTWFSLTASK
jgi:peptide/nickel transport system substrate-binding protein